jgi:anti-sigma factor RsiW
MHELLDEEISPNNEKMLREHLYTCSECMAYFRQMKKAVALFQSTSTIHAPENFTASVMARLPINKKRHRLKSLMFKHPLVTAASLFILLMTGSLISTWQKDHEFSVTNQENLIVHNNQVIVPKGEVIKGDIIVRDGELRIEGEVQGDVTVINGEQYVASAGHVSGEIEEVNRTFDWLWYHIKKTSKDLISVFKGEDK